MIGGVEAIHDWAGGVTLNDRADGPPFYRVRRIDGLQASADFEPPTDPAMGRIGEVARLGDRGGRTLTYEGEIVATDLVEMREMASDLVAAFSGTDEQRMDVSKHPSYTGLIPDRFYHARPVECTVDDEQVTNPWRVSRGYERAYSLTLRLSDPRFYEPGAETPSSFTMVEAEGIGFPVQPPFTLDPPGSMAISITCTNNGNAPTDAEFRLHGPCQNPVLSTVGANPDRFLRFRDLHIPDGEYVAIDFRRRRVIREGGENVRNKLDPSSTWWDRGVPCLEPGNTTVRFRAYAMEAPAQLEGIFNHADYS